MALSSSAEHVVIIGGGATSALIAVRLAERGFRVTVLVFVEDLLRHQDIYQ